MNWAWASSLDQLWRSPAFPVWLTLAAAGFFALIVLVTLLRAEKSVANGALTVITLLAIGIAVAATIRRFDTGGQGGSSVGAPQATVPSLAALACIDDLAGEAVLTACEKSLFGSPESAAAALSYAASQISRLVALGDVATANRNLTSELQMLRRSIERDRYGLMAYALAARDHCMPSQCAAFRSLADSRQIASNMADHLYDSLIARYSPSWNAPAAAPAPMAALPPSMPTGKPTNADFPSAASTPPVNIMTPEPVTGSPSEKRPAPVTNAPQRLTPTPAPTPAPAKRPPGPKAARSAPVQLTPAEPDAGSDAPLNE